MNTRELGRRLGAIDVICVDTKMKTKLNNQPFDYILVLDFEATCWDQSDTNKGQSEIIEFPVVLYSVLKNEIIDEFQQYVTPTEHPKLSDFCISLTGIQQNQVDNGVSLSTCLFMFMRWIGEKMDLYNMNFPNSNSSATKSKCVFATWSNWDLGKCLKNECQRKRISYHSMFHRWIDVRALYRAHYRRAFSGLAGALAEVGLHFQGNQHCGLDDARNTARLIGKMISDGVIFQITN